MKPSGSLERKEREGAEIKGRKRVRTYAKVEKKREKKCVLEQPQWNKTWTMFP